MTNISALAANIFVMHVADRCDLSSDAGTPVDRIQNVARHAYEAAKIFAVEQEGHEAEAKQAAYAEAVAAAERAEQARLAAEAEALAAAEPSADYAELDQAYLDAEDAANGGRTLPSGYNPADAEPDSIASYRPAVAEAATEVVVDCGNKMELRQTINDRPEDHAGWNPEDEGHG